MEIMRKNMETNMRQICKLDFNDISNLSKEVKEQIFRAKEIELDILKMREAILEKLSEMHGIKKYLDLEFNFEPNLEKYKELGEKVMVVMRSN